MKKVILVIVIILVIIQFIPVSIDNPTVNEGQDLFSTVNAPNEVKATIVNACYDCHSFKTKEPWYFNIAPISWWLLDHVKEGREHLNFSMWAAYDQEKQAHKMEEAAEELEEKHMPLKSYIWMHKEAQMTDEQRQLLVKWFEQQRKILQL